MWVRVYIGGGYMYLIDFRVVGYWVREGVFFCTFFSTFYLFYLYATCILLRSFCAFLIQFLSYIYINVTPLTYKSCLCLDVQPMELF